jgi:hypothetical protein
MAFYKVGNPFCANLLGASWILGIKHCIGHLFNNYALGRESVGRELEYLSKEDLLFVVCEFSGVCRCRCSWKDSKVSSTKAFKRDFVGLSCSSKGWKVVISMCLKG